MTTLHIRSSTALDASAHEFIATFMSHVATLVVYGPDRGTTIARVTTLLLAALDRAGGSDAAWRLLHGAIFEIVATANFSHDKRGAQAYLQSFLQENVDLATSVPSASESSGVGVMHAASHERAGLLRRHAAETRQPTATARCPGAFKDRPIARVAIAVLWLTGLVLSVGSERAVATPVFAQAYGLSCTACHTQMPVLNAFGRYIQRTGYAALNRKTLSHAVPAFLFDLGTAYTHQAGQPARDDRITGPGNTSVFQANGFLGPDETYKVEQLITAGGRAGVLDQVWVAYHDLLDHHGHLFVGKLAEINLDEFSAFVLGDVNDAGQGSVPDVAVGVHDYALDYDGGRWGAKFNYVQGKTLAQIAYLGNATGGNSFGDWYDFSQASDTSVQWRIAYADPAKPYELGVFGESGALGFTGSGLMPGLRIDHYTVVAPYVQKDPRPGSPGFRFEYATATDSNPGYVRLPSTSAGPQPAGSTASSWMIGSVSQMVLHDHGMVNLSYYHTNEALSEIGFTGLLRPTGAATGAGPGFSYAFNPYTRIYSAFYVAQNQRPTIALKMWFSPPLWNRLK